MSSPFPGMDPYLEDPGLWPDVHHEFISVSREMLNRRLRPKYHVRVEVRVYISDENDPGRAVIVPDLRIRAVDDDSPLASQPPDTSMATVVEPLTMTTLIEDEIHEARLEIIDRLERSVVTVIEILSPTYKVAGSRGRESYERKRKEVMYSPSHFVEIGLLREGVPLHTREALPDADYYVHVSRHGRRPQGTVWPILLPQRLPSITVPLRPEDPDLELDLQAVLGTVYERAAYDLEIDYRQDPAPPVRPQYAEWVHCLLTEKGLR